MEHAMNFFSVLQIFFTIIIGMYFWNMLRSQQGSKIAIERDSRKEMDRLQRMRSISLTEPLAERTRPSHFSDIVGQEEGIKALRAALCGPNPQHVLLYGPPGVGKTAAARLVLQEAKKNPMSPFSVDSKFIELDATTARFDERGIADPLIGTVHDPIYQGAGQLGMAGIPQPKPGAVTKAHGGILFIDEVGELHPTQMNKLLKVLEDRKVFLESSYYTSEDQNIPQHIHDIFQNGLPADFRLVGATTRQAHEIPPAIRSRCVEIFFRPLWANEVRDIAKNAANKIEFTIEIGALDVLERYASNGREAVNIVQIAAGIAHNNGTKNITTGDIEWVINFGQYNPRIEKKIITEPQVGFCQGLAVAGPNMGTLLEIEASAMRVRDGNGKITVTGVVEEEEMGAPGRTVKRKSMVKGSVDNVATLLKEHLNLEIDNYNIHINFPGGVPVDGPSAGVSIATAVYSAVCQIPVCNSVAMTGEVSLRGLVKPVGGVPAKVTAAQRAGAKKVLIPKENWQQNFTDIKDIEIIPVEKVEEVFYHALVAAESVPQGGYRPSTELLTASSL